MADPIPYTMSEAGALALRVAELEHTIRHFDKATMDLHLYIQAVVGQPDAGEWQVVMEMAKEIVDAYGPRNPHR